MCLAQGPQGSDIGEARTHGLSVSSQALYHWATALPINFVYISAGLVLVSAIVSKGCYILMHVSPYSVCIVSDDRSIVPALVMSVSQPVGKCGRTEAQTPARVLSISYWSFKLVSISCTVSYNS